MENELADEGRDGRTFFAIYRPILKCEREQRKKATFSLLKLATRVENNTRLMFNLLKSLADPSRTKDLPKALLSCIIYFILGGKACTVVTICDINKRIVYRLA